MAGRDVSDLSGFGVMKDGACTAVMSRRARWAIGALASLLVACGDDGTNSADGVMDASSEVDLTGAEVSDTATESDTTGSSDLGDGSDTSTPDTTGTLETGEPCSEDEQCVSEWCVPSALGPICVPPCGDGCENDWVCVPASDTSSDPVYLCVPIAVPNPPVGDTSDTTTPSDSAVETDGSADTSSDTTTPPDAADTTSDTTSPDTADTTSDTTSPDTADTTSDTTSPDSTDTADTVDTDTGNPIGDDDGDGIPNDEDNLPCLAIMLTIYNDDVTSASVELNDQEVVNSSAFPTEDPITVYINPVSGENTLSLGGKLGGSPRDSLTLLVWDTQGNVYFTTVIVRQPGPPQTQTFTFVLDATCP